MSNASDIKNLFGRFGGNPQHYRELALENDAQDSAARWPLLSNIANHKRLAPNAASVFQADKRNLATDAPALAVVEPSVAESAASPTLNEPVKQAQVLPISADVAKETGQPAVSAVLGGLKHTRPASVFASSAQSAPAPAATPPAPAVSASPVPADVARPSVSPFSRLQAKPLAAADDGTLQTVLRRLAHGGQPEEQAPATPFTADAVSRGLRPTVSSILSRLAKR